jgi:Family of unknown function (DUF6289)
MLKKTAILTVALTAAIFVANAVPAQAIPTLPPAVPDLLMVTAFYSDPARTQLVGQAWSGCGKPSGSWGLTTSYRNVFFPQC